MAPFQTIFRISPDSVPPSGRMGGGAVDGISDPTLARSWERLGVKGVPMRRVMTRRRVEVLRKTLSGPKGGVSAGGASFFWSLTVRFRLLAFTGKDPSPKAWPKRRAK